MYFKRVVSPLARKAARLASHINWILKDEIWRNREFQAFLLFMILLAIVVVGLIGGFVGIPFPRDDVIIR